MSKQKNSRTTDKSTCSRESEGSRSLSSSQTLGQIAASLQQAGPAQTCPSQGEEKDLKENTVPYGTKPSQPLAWYDLNTLCWKTYQRYLHEDWTKFSARWPRSGFMTANGTVYPLPTLALRTAGTASGLSESGKMWPTPKSSVSGPDYARAKRPRSGGDDLATAVARKMWPTPSANDNRDRGHMGSPAIQRRIEKGKQLNLSMVVSKTSGALSADWVSILMGYSLDWTTIVEDGSAESQESSRVKKTGPKD